MAKRRRRSPATPAPERLILDSGAVIALARDDPRARAVLTAAWKIGADVSIPAIVLADTVRGSGEDAPVNRVVKAVGQVLPVDEPVGRTAGSLLAASGTNAAVDAVVVASAMAVGGAVVLTGDPDDLGPLAAGHPQVVIRPL